MHTRRAVLAASPALSVLAAAPGLAALPSPSRHPDAHLLALAKRHAEARLRFEGAARAAEAAEKAAAAERPARPEAFGYRPGDWFRMVEPTEPGRFHTLDSIDRWERALRLGHYRDLMTPTAAERFKARGRELIAARRAHLAAIKAADAAHGVRPAAIRADRAGRALYDIERRVLDTPATTLDGLRAKAGIIAALIGEPDGTYEDRAMRALVADLAGVKVEAPALS